MELNLDVFSQFTRLVRELIAIVQEPADRRRERRKEFLNNEIAPAHAAMQAIHRDYTETFTELLGLLQSGDDWQRTIELLKTRRLVFVTQRADIRGFAAALADVKKRGGYVKERELNAFEKYVNAILEYLRQASPADARVSWYSHFIEHFEFLVEHEKTPYGFYEGISTSKPPAEIVKSAYADAVHRDIPEAWAEYSTAYHNLELELTR
ncbi:hypothetical protein [Solirubrobacter soli]|uniref:hypothetical protein n=1 Tax=Solirubrobacter soli TaxID=363832 RepID=UPI0003F54C4E|nr:hypothetical protein [Solirubrobacter soli]